MAINIFEVIEGLTVDREDILEAEMFAEQYLKAEFPSYDFRQGTALRDMTVRPNATLIALVDKAIKKYFDDTDLMNVTDATDKDLVDSRLSNFLITRKSGSSARIRAKLYFSFPTASPISTIVPPDATFSTDGESEFSSETSLHVNPLPEGGLIVPGVLYFEYDSSEGMHFVEVDLVANGEGVEFNLDEGDLLYFTIFSPYFMSGKIMYLIDTAIDAESNLDMIERSYSSISTRNLINNPSIVGKISEQFNFVKQINPIGLGDEELYRDLISVNAEIFHRGGMVDIYVETPLESKEHKFQLDGSGCVYLKGPITKIRRTEGNEDETLPDADYRYSPVNVSKYIDGVPTTPWDDRGISATQELRLQVIGGTSNDVVTFDVESFTGTGGINDAINSKKQRVLCADYLSRAFMPIFVEVNIETRGLADTSGKAEDAVTAYIDGLGFGDTLTVSGIINAIQDTGITDFIMPIEVKCNVKNGYIEYSTLDDTVRDEEIHIISDSYQASTIQQFVTRKVSLKEAV